MNNAKDDKRAGISLKSRPWLIFALSAAILVGVAFFWEKCKTALEDIFNPSPNLVFDPHTGVVVDDSTGNNDGEVNPGERVNATLSLINTGDDFIPAFDLALRTPMQGVQVFEDTLHFPGIGASEQGSSRNPLSFEVDTSFVGDCIVFLGRKVEAAQRAVIMGGVTEMEDSEEIALVIPVRYNFRLSVGACILQPQGGSALLQFELILCNVAQTIPPADEPGPSLSDAGVTIEAAKLRVCKPPIPATETISPSSSSALFGNLGPGNASSAQTFQFTVPASWTLTLAGTPAEHAAIFFEAEVFTQASSATKTNRGKLSVAARAIVQSETPIE